MKIAIIFGDPDKKLSARLTKWFTGCTAYHVGFVDEANDKFYDMNLIRRRRIWSEYANKREFFLFDCPGLITASYLERALDTDRNRYGVIDYMLFALRPIYHLFGKSTRNAQGVICSEMVNIDVRLCEGWTPWSPYDPPPSPCDWFHFLTGRLERPVSFQDKQQ